MATPANAVSTALIKGQREDLIDIIYNIRPYDTPFMTAIGKGTAKAITHQWQTDALRSPALNTQIEGNDATINAATFTTMADNICQIVTETLQVTGTTEAVDKAGRKSELAYQLAKKGKEIKTDMEYMLVGTPLAKVARSSSVAGQAGNIFSYYKSNGSLGATGVAPTGNGVNTGTAGTQRVLTEQMILDASELIWQKGGQANTIHTSSSLKKHISKNFKGRATQIELDASNSTIAQAVDVYECDFGKYQIVANRFFKADALFMFDPKMHSLCYLRSFTQFPLAKTGDSEKRQMLAEYTFRVNNEESGALIRDVIAS
jgi:Family of unknown function (DUF5309)